MSTLAMGCTDGSVRVLDAATLLEEGVDDGVAIFKHCHDCITHLAFSHDSKYLASAVSPFVMYIVFPIFLLSSF